MNYKCEILGIRLCAIYLGLFGAVSFAVAFVAIRDGWVSQLSLPVILMSAIFLIYGIGITFTCYNLWRIKNSARSFSIWLLVIALLVNISDALRHSGDFKYTIDLGVGLLNAIFIIYLTRPNIKSIFTE